MVGGDAVICGVCTGDSVCQRGDIIGRIIIIGGGDCDALQHVPVSRGEDQGGRIDGDIIVIAGDGHRHRGGSDNPAVTIDSTTLTFTTSTWDTAQTVTVTAADDDAVADNIATLGHTITSADTAYNGITADLTVMVTDNDIPGLTLSPTSLTLDEGTTTLYTAVLDTLPSDTVTVTITSNNADVTPAPATLTFTMTNWHMPQSVTVTAAEDDDAADDVATLTHTVASSDNAL